jgi:hypothetical protein
MPLRTDVGGDLRIYMRQARPAGPSRQVSVRLCSSVWLCVSNPAASATRLRQ